MKLKDFNHVIEVIKAIRQQRGCMVNPRIFVSFVVYNYNVHELAQFLACIVKLSTPESNS